MLPRRMWKLLKTGEMLGFYFLLLEKERPWMWKGIMTVHCSLLSHWAWFDSLLISLYKVAFPQCPCKWTRGGRVSEWVMRPVIPTVPLPGQWGAEKVLHLEMGNLGSNLNSPFSCINLGNFLMIWNLKCQWRVLTSIEIYWEKDMSSWI